MKNYKALTDYIISELNRDDAETISNMNVWTRNAIDRIDRDLSLISMTRELVYDVAGGTTSLNLPQDFNHIVSLHSDTFKTAYSAVTIREIMEKIPYTYSHVGSTLMRGQPAEASRIVMFYRAAAKPLVDPDDTNEYLALFPQLLKELIIEQAWEFLQSPEKASSAGQRAGMIIASLDQQRARSEYKNGSKQRVLSNKSNKYF